MKKIAFVLYYYYPYTSGLSEYARAIAEELAKSNEVEVIVSKHKSDLPNEEVLDGVNIKRFKSWFSIGKGVFAPGIFWHIFKKRKAYDKVFIFLPMTEAMVFPFFLKKEKINSFYVCDIRVGSSFIAKIIEKILFFSMRFLLKRSSKIVPLSHDYFSASRIYSEEYEGKVIPVRPTSRITGRENNLDYREKFNINNDTFVIGFLGRIVYEKGADYLIKTVPVLKKMGISNFKIILGGDYANVRGGSVYEELKSLIDEYKDHVIVTGFIPEDEKASFFRSLNVFTLPSIDPLEAFGIVQLEAMGEGIPVVASNLPGVREIVQKTGYGLIATPKSSESLAQEISKIYYNKIELSGKKDKYKEVYNDAEWKDQLEKIVS